MSLDHSTTPRRTTLSAFLATGVCSLVLVFSGCSDRGGARYTITPQKDDSGGNLLRYQAQCKGEVPATGRSFKVTVLIWAPHSSEWAYKNTALKDVSMLLLTTDGPAWASEELEILPDHAATIRGLGRVGSQEVSTAGGSKTASVFELTVNPVVFSRFTGARSARFRIGTSEFDLDEDQLQGIAQLLNRLNKPPEG